jgi:hypothetical protein
MSLKTALTLADEQLTNESFYAAVSAYSRLIADTRETDDAALIADLTVREACAFHYLSMEEVSAQRVNDVIRKGLDVAHQARFFRIAIHFAENHLPSALLELYYVMDRLPEFGQLHNFPEPVLHLMEMSVTPHIAEEITRPMAALYRGYIREARRDFYGAIRDFERAHTHPTLKQAALLGGKRIEGAIKQVHPEDTHLIRAGMQYAVVSYDHDNNVTRLQAFGDIDERDVLQVGDVRIYLMLEAWQPMSMTNHDHGYTAYFQRSVEAKKDLVYSTFAFRGSPFTPARPLNFNRA